LDLYFNWYTLYNTTTAKSYVLTSWFEKYSPLLSELPSLFSDSWWTRLLGMSPLLHSELL
jgi:hypothetical protein